MPYDLTYRFGAIETIFDCSFYLPVSEYTALGGSRNAMMAGIDVKDGKEKAYDQWLTPRTKEIRQMCIRDRLLTAEEIARAADLAAVSRRAAGNEEKKRRRPKETALWEKISWDNLYHFPVCPQTQGW